MFKKILKKETGDTIKKNYEKISENLQKKGVIFW